MARRRVYGTHVTVCDSYVGHIDAIWPTEAEAREHAQTQSRFPSVLRASVTEFTLGELGTRRSVVWYRHGKADSNGRPFPTDGLKSVHDAEHLH